MSLFPQLIYKRFTDDVGNQTIIVSIEITDSVTNQPTPGNNIIVSYTQTQGGFSQYLQAICPGSITQIYNGPYSDGDNWVITGQSNDPTQPSIPPGACDLAINSVTVINPESAPGAADGSINVNATSSYGPIQYSLDNTTWQSSSTFTGLTGRSGTVYAKDANSCTASLSFVLPTASDLLVSDPSINLGNGNISRWSAAFNPIFFTFQRKDFGITSVISATDGSGNIQVAINTDLSSLKPGQDVTINDVLTHISGDLVYINTAKYEGAFEVLTVNSGSVILACAFTSTDTTGFANINALRPYYFIQTVITYVDPNTGKFNTIQSNNYPLTNGLCKCDFSDFLKSLLVAKSLSDYTQVNYRDMQLSASYTVKYAEMWSNNTPIWVTLANPYYVVFAAMQLGTNGGGNLVDFVPYPKGFHPAKWVTDLINPVYNYGFPFDVGFIFSEYMVGLQPYLKIILLDINENPLQDQGIPNAFLLNQNGGYQLIQSGGKFIIALQALVNTPISQQLGLNRLLVNFPPPAQCWWFSLQLQYDDTGTPGTVNYALIETATPAFIDGNLQIKINNNIAEDLFSNTSGQFNAKAGNTYSAEAYTEEASTAANPRLRLTVVKDNVTIFDEATPAIPGASLIKTGIIQPGSIYTFTAVAEDSADAVTAINIDDNNPVSATTYNLTQSLTCRVDQNTSDRSVYLRWIGLNGCWNYYRFVYDQKVGLNVTGSVVKKNYVIDWQNEDTIQDVIQKNAGKSMSLSAENMSVDDINGCIGIKVSPKVQMLTANNPALWQTIIVTDEQYEEYHTMLNQGSFNVTINLPVMNLQMQ